MILDFICELEIVVSKGPDTSVWNLAQVADLTGANVPQVVDIVTDTLERELEVHETITHAEAALMLAKLRERMAGELAARQRRIDAQREKAVKAYDLAIDRVRALEAAKNWRSAYKTLSYYVGCHEKDIPFELMQLVAGDCLRLGAKCQANLQEMSQWLRKGIQACLAGGTIDAIEEAIDFLDAYGDYFVDDGSEPGKRLLRSVVESVKDAASHHELPPRVNELLQTLCI